MKRIIITLLAVTISISAYQIKNSWWEGSGSTRHKATNVTCNSGEIITIQYYPSSNSYTYHGKSFLTFSKAVSNFCSTSYSNQSQLHTKKLHTNFTKVSHSKNIARTSKKALVCKTKKDIEQCLHDNISFEICMQSANLDYRRLGDRNWRDEELKKECFILKNKKIILIKTHTKKENNLDGYTEIKDGEGRLFYIKNSDI